MSNDYHDNEKRFEIKAPDVQEIQKEEKKIKIIKKVIGGLAFVGTLVVAVFAHKGGSDGGSNDDIIT